MNFANLRHVGRPKEFAYEPKAKGWHPSMAAKAASPAVSVGGDARTRVEIETDERNRTILSKERELFTLTKKPEIHDMDDGSRVYLLRGTRGDEAGRTYVAYMHEPLRDHHDPAARAETEKRVSAMEQGAVVSLAGEWKQHDFMRDGIQRSAWRFQTQRLQAGDVPLEAMAVAREPARMQPAGLAAAHAARAGMGY